MPASGPCTRCGYSGTCSLVISAKGFERADFMVDRLTDDDYICQCTECGATYNQEWFEVWVTVHMIEKERGVCDKA